MAASTGTVVILGAGPAGLSTGYALARAGWNVQVYEQATMVGGLARTVEKDGFRFDIGGHRWFTKKDELNHFLIDLLGEELVMVNRISRIFFDGKFVGYPLKVGEVLSRIGPATGAKALGDFALTKAAQTFSKKPVVNMEDAYVQQFGRTLYELFFKNYSEKVWGDECSNLSGDWVTQRSKGMSLLTAVKDAIKRTDGKVESLVERFMYPGLGYGRISERMQEEIERTGGKVHLGYRVVGVKHDGTRITSVRVSDGRDEQEVMGDNFVSSIPMTELARIMTPSADQSLVNASHTLTYRGVITVHMMLNRPMVTDDTWLYVHDQSLSFARLHEPRNWSPQMAPEGKTSLVLEVFSDAEDPTWNQSDEAICKRAEKELVEKLRFIEPGDVIGSFAERSRDAYPRYGLGYRDAVDAIKRYLRGFENLNIVGRGGTFRYNNADHSIETGLIAARNILGDSAISVDDVNSEQEYLEERRIPARVSANASAVV